MALSVWQSQQRIKQSLQRATGDSRRLLQNIKPRLTEALSAAGLIFHGRQIRRPRASKTLSRDSSTLATSRRQLPAQSSEK
jgi:hypothetical protein